MSNANDIFKHHQAQTFPSPSCLEIKSAKGSYITDIKGKKYLDFVSGVSACTLGHSNPIISNAVKGMLPHNKLGKKLLTHLKVYSGSKHPHSSQNPQKLDI